jgi:hypothetical protein
MFVSFTFAYLYSVLSLGCFVKDIFAKDICKHSYQNTIIINDLTRSFSLVSTNFEKLCKALIFIDIYFFVFGSNYGLLSSIIYLVFGLPIMFIINSIMTFNTVSYSQSVKHYLEDTKIKYRNPLLCLYCDSALVNNFCYVLYLQAFFFGRNEYLMILFVLIPMFLAVITSINIDFSRINEEYDLDNFFENKKVKQIMVNFLFCEQYAIRFFNKANSAVMFLKRLTGLNSARVQPRNELGNINTYDTIPEINNKTNEEIKTILKTNSFLDELNDPSGVNNNIEAQMDKNQENLINTENSDTTPLELNDADNENDTDNTNENDNTSENDNINIIENDNTTENDNTSNITSLVEEVVENVSINLESQLIENNDNAESKEPDSQEEDKKNI